MDTNTDLIIKSFGKKLSESERCELENCLADEENKKKYASLKAVYTKALEAGSQISPDAASGWKAFLNRIKPGRRRLSRTWRVATVAACAAAVACVSVLLFKDLYGETTKLPTMDEYIAAVEEMPGLKDTRLVLSDGKSIDIDSRYSEIIISENGSYSINSVSIVSSAHEGYSRVIVPERHWVHLVLPDGSRVDLNSSSDFICPSTFSETERRFNMKSRDNLSEVTLVQGKVSVTDDGGKSCILSPSEQVRLENGELTEAQAVDTEAVTCWTKPRMICRNQNIEQVAEKLATYYGVKFHYTESLKDLREELESVLNTIAFTAPVSFETDGDTVEIHRTDKF